MIHETLILGIGNTLLSDDGLGIQTIKHMKRFYNKQDAIKYLDGSLLNQSLLTEIEQTSNLIIINATKQRLAPGTISCYSGRKMDSFLRLKGCSAYEMALHDLLEISKLTGNLPTNRALISVQPKVLSWGNKLSPLIHKSIPLVAKQALSLVTEWNIDVMLDHPQEACNTSI